MRIIVATTLACVALAADVAIAQTPLEGRWTSAAPEPLPGRNGDTNYLVRTFTFTGDRWSIDFTLYDDEAGTRPILSGSNRGSYRLEAALKNEAQAAEFDFAERTLTPRNEATAAALAAANCGSGPWTVGQAQSVAAQGCEAFRVFSRDRCPREYDLVRVEGEQVFLGARPADGFICSPDRRPASTSLAPLVPEAS